MHDVGGGRTWLCMMWGGGGGRTWLCMMWGGGQNLVMHDVRGVGPEPGYAGCEGLGQNLVMHDVGGGGGRTWLCMMCLHCTAYGWLCVVKTRLLKDQ